MGSRQRMVEMSLPAIVSEAVRRLNPGLFGGGTAPPLSATKPSNPRLRQHKGDGMNKTERAYLIELKAKYPTCAVLSQAISFRLANGANYRPDFIVISPFGDWMAFETKGFKREASAVRIKVAASLYQFISFTLVTKRKKRDGGGWLEEIVLP